MPICSKALIGCDKILGTPGGGSTVHRDRLPKEFIMSYPFTPSVKFAALAFVAAIGGTALGFASRQMVATSAAEAKPLTVGATAPDVTIQNLKGKNLRLAAILRNKPTILIFYRGGWCPFCNAHLSDLATIEDQVRARGFQIVAISPDTPIELNKTITKDRLPYQLYSDSSANAMKKYGVAYRLDDPTFMKMRDGYGVDLEKWSGRNHHILPVPSVFVIDKLGTIQFVHSNPDYKVRMKSAEIMKVIDAMP
jgi:peroxiredoxin